MSAPECLKIACPGVTNSEPTAARQHPISQPQLLLDASAAHNLSWRRLRVVRPLSRKELLLSPLALRTRDDDDEMMMMRLRNRVCCQA